MVRRCVLILALALCAPRLPAQHVTTEILVHSGVTAGLAHHEAKVVWDELRVGDSVALVREPDNRHDANAVRIEWHGRLLGYLPRTDNQPVARQIDRGSRLQGRIARLGRYRNHRMRLEVDILLPL
jgi:hypothetical protein